MHSYEKINYLLRPNKSVERKMICDMLVGLSSINNMNSYCYIGFGSTYFADFSLFHRRLGINHMISIESEERAKSRCEFNKPYACIELVMGKSSTILPNLEINKKDCIIWLDYDGMISETVFSDIKTVITMMKPGGFFMLSVNADLKCLKKRPSEESIDPDLLLDIIGEDRFPTKYIGKKVTSKIYLDILYNCIIQQIQDAVQKRNGLEETQVAFHQAINFVYMDGAKMITLGGFILDKEKEADCISKMQIMQYPFYRNGEDNYIIRCPKLSIKEIQTINNYLPCKPMDKDSKQFEDERLNEFPVENEDIDDYASLYRYFPNYVETLL